MVKTNVASWLYVAIYILRNSKIAIKNILNLNKYYPLNK